MAKKEFSKKVSKKAAKKVAMKKTAKKAAKKVAKKVARKTAVKAAKKVIKKAAHKKEEPVVQAPPIELIAHAAYLNYISRVEQGLPGDEQGDWLAAEESLRVA